MIKNIILSCVLLLSLSSCEDFFTATKEIDLEEYAGQITVVGRLINTDLDTVENAETFRHLGVLISESRSVLDTSSFKVVEDADISLVSNGGLDVSFRFDDNSGYHFPTNANASDFQRISVEENTEYQLIVDMPGEDRVTAICETKTFGKVNNINLIRDDIDGGDGSTLDRVQINIDDPTGENFYYLNVFYEREQFSVGERSTFLNRGYLYSYNSIFDDSPELFTDELFDGKTETLEFWSERYERQDLGEISRVIVFLWSLSKEEYDFRRSVDANNEAQDNPFAEPSIVFSNIENGVGIFSMSKIDRFVIPWE